MDTLHQRRTSLLGLVIFYDNMDQGPTNKKYKKETEQSYIVSRSQTLPTGGESESLHTLNYIYREREKSAPEKKGTFIGSRSISNISVHCIIILNNYE